MNSLSTYLNSINEALQNLDLETCGAAQNVVWQAFQNKNQVFTCGNGGSASTAMHYAVDWSKGIREKSTISGIVQNLNSNIAVMTAIANDISYDDIFSYQLEMFMKPEDVLVAVSGSGNSPNIIRALEVSRSLGGINVGVLGFNGGGALALCDYVFHVKTQSMQVFEDISSVFGHSVLVNY